MSKRKRTLKEDVGKAEGNNFCTELYVSVYEMWIHWENLKRKKLIELVPVQTKRVQCI